jgi:hypothetical protein
LYVGGCSVLQAAVCLVQIIRLLRSYLEHQLAGVGTRVEPAHDLRVVFDATFLDVLAHLDLPCAPVIIDASLTK